MAKFMAIPHYVYLLLKMHGKTGDLTFHGDLQRSFECEKEAITYASTNRLPDTAGEVLAVAQQYSASGSEIPTKKTNCSAPKPPDNIGVKAIQLQEDDPSKTALIGTGLTDKYKSALVNFLRANRDIFAWKPADMPGVPKELIEHSLNVNPTATPKK